MKGYTADDIFGDGEPKPKRPMSPQQTGSSGVRGYSADDIFDSDLAYKEAQRRSVAPPPPPSEPVGRGGLLSGIGRSFEAREATLSGAGAQRAATGVDFYSTTPTMKGPRQTFGEAFGRGVDTTQELLFRFVEASGELVGNEQARQWGKAGAERNRQEAEASGKPQSSVSEVRNIADFGQWAKETIGMQIPILAPSVVASVAGAAAAPAVGATATVGAAVGAFAGSFGLGVGETQAAIKDKDPDAVKPGFAFLGGSAVAALDSVLPGKFGSALARAIGTEPAEYAATRILTKPLTEEMLVRGAQGAVTGMATEAVTEALQESIVEVTAAAATGQRVDWKALGEQAIEAAAAGALIGAGTGAATGALEARAERRGAANWQTPRDPEAQQRDIETGAPLLSPDDITSPIPNELIAEGKGAIANAQAEMAQSGQMQLLGLPAKGSRVSVSFPAMTSPTTGAEISPASTVGGVLADFYEVDDEAGPVPGVRLQLDDGRSVDDLLGTLRNSGVSIGPEQPASPTPDASVPDQGEQASQKPLRTERFITSGDGYVTENHERLVFGTQREAARFIIENDLNGRAEVSTDGEGVFTLKETAQAAENRKRAFRERLEADRAAKAAGQGQQGLTTTATGSRDDKIEAQTAADLEQAAVRVATPTDAQKEAGNYRKAHVKVGGLDITIETPKGAERSGTDPDGNAWSVKMPAHYGYVKRTVGADTEQVDVYVGDNPRAEKVWIVDQYDADTGRFDEHKVMLGFDSYEDAMAAYDAAFSDGRGPERRGDVTETDAGALAAALTAGSSVDWTGPLSTREPSQAPVSEKSGPTGSLADLPAGTQPDMLGGPAVSEQDLLAREQIPEWRQRIADDEITPDAVEKAAVALLQAEANGQPRKEWVEDAIDILEGSGGASRDVAFDLAGAMADNPALARLLAGRKAPPRQEPEGANKPEQVSETDWIATETDVDKLGSFISRMAERSSALRDRADAMERDGASPADVVDLRRQSQEARSLGNMAIDRQDALAAEGKGTPARFPGQPSRFSTTAAGGIKKGKGQNLYPQSPAEAAAFNLGYADVQQGIELEDRGATFSTMSDSERAAYSAGIKEARGQAGTTASDELGAGNASPPGSAKITEMPSGKSVIVKGASQTEMNAVAAALGPRITPLWNQSQKGWVYSKKHAGAIRAALDKAAVPKREFADPATLTPRQAYEQSRDPEWRSPINNSKWGPIEPRLFRLTPDIDKAIRAEANRRYDDYDSRTAFNGGAMGQGFGSIRANADMDAVMAAWEAGMEWGRGLGPDGKPAATSGQATPDREAIIAADEAKALPAASNDSVATSRAEAEALLRDGKSFKKGRTNYSVRPSKVGNDSYAVFTKDDDSPVGFESGPVGPGVAGYSKEAAVTEALNRAFPQPVRQPATPASKPAAEPKVFTNDAAAEARKRMQERMNNQTNAGIDPEMLRDGIVIVGNLIERGVIRFNDVARQLASDFGATIHQLRAMGVRGWYNGARDTLEDQGVDVSALDNEDQVRGQLKKLIEEEQAGAAQPRETEADDRSRNGGTGAADAPATEGVGQPGQRADSESGSGRTDLRSDDVEPDVRSDEGTGTDTAGTGRETATDQDGGGARRAGSGGRVRAKPDGAVDFSAPAGALQRTGSWKATADRNLDIIELVQRIEAENRPATAAEQAEMVKFTGWGASEIRQGLFPAGSDRTVDGVRTLVPRMWGEWKDISARAAEILKGDALQSALQSTQYAHYTSEAVIRAIWSGVERMGFKGGRIFEPGMGIGLFPVAAPSGVMQGSTYTGIELNQFTGRVAKLLLPNQNVVIGDYTKTAFPNGFFDLAIGNPPFANIKITSDPDYKRQRFSLHDYFFAKSLDKVRPGGLLVFVTSRFTMDKLHNKARAYMAERADLIGAIRLPQTAFQQNAGTEVVTDVLFFRKRAPGEAGAGAAWLGNDEIKTKEGEKYLINQYFVQNPDMVLGDHSSTGTMYKANDYTVTPPKQDIEAAFAAAVERLPADIYSASSTTAAMEKRVETAGSRDFDINGRKEGGVYVKDGKLLRVESGVGVPLSEIERLSAKDAVWLKDYVGVRTAVKQAQLDQLKDGDWRTSLDALQKAYRGFVRKHGPISDFTTTERTKETPADEDTPGAYRSSDGEWVTAETVMYRRFKNQRLLDMDIEGPLVAALEKIDQDNNIVEGAFLKDRTLNKPVVPVINSPQDAVGVSLDQLGRFDINHVAELANTDVDAVVKALGDSVFEAPGEGWQTSDEYLSGNVREKLQEAEAAAATDTRFQRNVEALRKAQPAPLGSADITVRLGSGWVPAEVVQQFAESVLGVRGGISYNPEIAFWTIEAASGAGSRSNRYAGSEWGTAERGPAEILDAVLNFRKIYVEIKRDKVKDTEASNNATAAANDKATKIRERFERWVWEDGKRAQQLVGLYNEKFNNMAPRTFSGDHLTLPGLSLKYRLYAHQKRAIWRIIQTGDTYLAHAVGAGKTLEMIVSAMEQRRLGLVKKPMFVVPNHMLDQFAREFLDAYPAANIMVASEKAFHTDNRRRFMAQAALNDLDAIIVTHSSFGKIAPSDQSRQRVLDRLLSELEESMEAMKDDAAKHTRKKIENRIEQLTQRFEGKAGNAGKDQTLNFDEMGIDMLYVDEAHLFRKLDYATQRQVKGIDPVGSSRSLDLFIKTQALKLRNPKRSLVLASGTPVTNTMAELYTIQRYMDMDGLDRDGLGAFDAWAAMFGEEQTKLEPNAAGRYEPVTRFRKFTNVPELMKRVRSFMDVLTSSQLGDLVKRPDVKTGGPQSEITSITPELNAYMKGELSARIQRSKNWKPSRDEPNNPDPMIAIIGDARLASIDMRFIDPTLPSNPKSKLNVMIDKIIAIHKQTAGAVLAGQDRPGATQIVFSPLGFGEGVAINRGFNAKEWMVRRFAEQGIPRSQLLFMDELDSHAKKEAGFKEMRAGTKRILVGSPMNMGTGVNVQSRLYALHYLAPPWYPADVEQPHGRIIRQGNLNEEVELFWYATKGTYDSTGWSMVASKARMIEQAMIGNDIRTIDDISEVSQYDMASALAAGDERIIKMSGLRADVERLTRLMAQHQQDQWRISSKLRQLRGAIPRYQQILAAEKKAAAAVGTMPLDYQFVIDGSSIDKPGKAGDAMIDMAKAAVPALRERVAYDSAATTTIPAGTLFGFPIKMELEISRAQFDKGDPRLTVSVEVEGQTRLPLDGTPLDGIDPAGLGQRIRNALASFRDDARKTEIMIANDRAEMAALEKQENMPFPQQAELNDKTAELAGIEAALAGEAEAEKKAEDAAKRGTNAGQDKQNRRRDDAMMVSRTGDSTGEMSVGDMAAVEAALTRRLFQLGLDGKVSLWIRRVIRSLSSGERLPGVDGTYFNRIMQVAYRAPDPVWTLNHEAVHALREAGVFTAMEWRLLSDAARKGTVTVNGQQMNRLDEVRDRYPDLSEDALIEEAVSDMFADWAADRIQPKGFVRAALQRVKQLLEALYDAFFAAGFPTAASVMRSIDRGDRGRAMTAEGASQQERRSQGEVPSSSDFEAKPSVDMGRMAKLLGSQLYGDPTEIAKVTVKEIFQNSVDSIRPFIGTPGFRGRIKFETPSGDDGQRRKLLVTDNGSGMTAKILGTKFLQIAGTNKENELSTGGFGIAKMLFLYGNKAIKVVTMRDGTVSEMETTGEVLRAALDDAGPGPRIKTRQPTEADNEMFPDGHGTHIEVDIDKDFKDRSGETKAIEQFDRWSPVSLDKSPIFQPVDVIYNGIRVGGVGTQFDVEGHRPVLSIKAPWGDARLYMAVEKTTQWGNNVNVLNNGLFQFGMKLSLNPMDPYADAIPHVFYLDLRPSVRPEDNGYPIELNRQGLSVTGKRDLQPLLAHMQKLFQAEAVKADASLWDDAVYLDSDGRPSEALKISKPAAGKKVGVTLDLGAIVTIENGRMLVDGKELPPLTKEAMAESTDTRQLKVDQSEIDGSRPMMQRGSGVITDTGEAISDHFEARFGAARMAGYYAAIARNMLELRNAIADNVAGLKVLREQAFGFTQDPTVYGVSIRAPFSGVFINPFVVGTQGKVTADPTEASREWIETIIHEAAHEKQRNHDAAYVQEYGRIVTALLDLMEDGVFDLLAFRRRFKADMAGYGDILEYAKGLKDGKRLERVGEAMAGDRTTVRQEFGTDGGVSNDGERAADQGARQSGAGGDRDLRSGVEGDGRRQGGADGAAEGPERLNRRRPPAMVDGKPSTNSRGQPIASTDDGVRAFWRWFGNSKAVDAKGQPLVLYHGSPSTFDTFKESERGIFFTDRQRLAEEYTQKRAPWVSGRPDPARVKAVYLKTENPLEINALGKRSNNVPVPWQRWKPVVYGRLPAGAQRIEDVAARAFADGRDSAVIKDVVDGITAEFRSSDKSTVYVVRDPSQIRAVGADEKMNRRRPSPNAFQDPQTEARWQDARQGIRAPGQWLAETKDWLEWMATGFTRHWKALPNIERFADVGQQLRKFEAAPANAKETVVEHLRAITKGLDAEDMDLLTRKVVLDDLAWEAQNDHDLPFGFTKTTLADAIRDIDAAVANKPKVLAAVRKRKVLVSKVSADLVAAGVLKQSQVQNPAYYRHQVLEYARAATMAAKGNNNRLQTPRWAKRQGSTLDINANLLEAEFDWLHKAMVDIAAAKTIAWIKKSDHNIRPDLLRQAKASNDAGLAAALVDDMKANGYTTRTGRQTSPLNEELTFIKQKIAVGFKKLEEELLASQIVVPQQYQAAESAILSGQQNDNTFAFLEWLLETNHPAAMGAGMIMRGTAMRRQFVKDVLGKDYADPHDIDALIRRFAPPGYVAWQPDDGKLLFTAKTMPQHIIDMMIQRVAAPTAQASGVTQQEMVGLLAQVKDMLVVGGDRFKLVIPEELAVTLNSLRDVHAQTLLDAIVEKPASYWKRWILINPRSVLRYNLNNMAGDIDAVIAGKPSVLRRMPEAISELWKVQIKGQQPSARYREAVERGVFDSGLSIQEIPDINELSDFSRLLDQPKTLGQNVRKLALTPFAAMWRSLNRYTQFRENWVRYAAYLDYVDRIEAGEAMDSIGYGATNPKMVAEITDPKDRAALLARDLVGDYGNISYWGQGIRRKLIPFWSFMEINFGRYNRLIANAYRAGIGAGIAKTGIVGGILGARVTAYMMIRMAVLYGLVTLWNQGLFGDEMDELPEEERYRLQLIMGKDDDGKIRVVRFQGSLSDYISWIGMPDLAAVAMDVEKGRAGIGDVAKEVAAAPVNKLANSLTPVLSLPIETVSGESWWPDVFNPRPIRDGWRNVFATFALENEYDVVMDKPSRGYAKSLTGTLYRKSDTGEAAYNEIRSKSYTWLQREKGKEGAGAASTPASKALYEWRMAKRFGDEDAEAKALRRLQELGVTGDRRVQSLKRARPLGHMSNIERLEFRRTLSDKEREQLERAETWYREAFMGDAA